MRADLMLVGEVLRLEAGVASVLVVENGEYDGRTMDVIPGITVGMVN
jgi:hypothetical protein